MNETIPKNNHRINYVMVSSPGMGMPVGSIVEVAKIPDNVLILLDRRITEHFAPELFSVVGGVLPDLTPLPKISKTDTSLMARIKFLLFGTNPTKHIPNPLF